LLLAEIPKTVKGLRIEVGRKSTSTRWHDVRREALAKLYHSCRSAETALGCRFVVKEGMEVFFLVGFFLRWGICISI